MAAQKKPTVKADKDTIGQIWSAVQKLDLQIAGLGQNVNAVGSNTNAASAKVNAVATGQAAGGASAILMIAAAGLVLFWFWKGK
jgi:hypothetical protein